MTKTSSACEREFLGGWVQENIFSLYSFPFNYYLSCDLEKGGFFSYRREKIVFL